MSSVQIILTKNDYSKLKAMKSCHPGSDYKKLEEEIEHAQIISTSELPKDVVTLNSHVTLLILEENKEINLTIVYPCDADFLEKKLSVLAPLSMNLLGLRINEETSWVFPDGQRKTLKIINVDPGSESNVQLQ